jgi:recombination protein RecT
MKAATKAPPQNVVAQRKTDVAKFFEMHAARISRALPQHCKPQRMLELLQQYASSPELASCTMSSLALCLIRLSQLGLDVSMHEAAVVPFWNSKKSANEAKLLVEYKGLLKLAYQSSRVTKALAREVYARDEFLWDAGNEKLTHIPYAGGSGAYSGVSSETIVAAYAKIWLRDNSEPLIEVMYRWEIDAIRARARASGDGPWVTDYGMMARKTVLRRALKYVPLSPELTAAADEDEGGFVAADVIDFEETTAPTSTLDEVIEKAMPVPKEPEVIVADREDDKEWRNAVDPSEAAAGEINSSKPREPAIDRGKLIAEIEKHRTDQRYAEFFNKREVGTPAQLSDADLQALARTLKVKGA